MTEMCRSVQKGRHDSTRDLLVDECLSRTDAFSSREQVIEEGTSKRIDVVIRGLGDHKVRNVDVTFATMQGMRGAALTGPEREKPRLYFARKFRARYLIKTAKYEEAVKARGETLVAFMLSTMGTYSGPAFALLTRIATRMVRSKNMQWRDARAHTFGRVYAESYRYMARRAIRQLKRFGCCMQAFQERI